MLRVQPQAGQNIVEFALVISLVLTVTLGILDFGRLFYTDVGLTNAAREGARCATLSQPPLCNNVPVCNAANIKARVVAEQPYLFQGKTEGLDYIISPDCTQPDRRTVSISYRFPLANPFLAPLVGEGGSTNVRLSTWATLPVMK